MMITVHRIRRTTFCTALALCCLPGVVSAQQSKSKANQSDDTSLYANDLTREAVGSISNLDETVQAEARMTPGPNSHMVVMGAVTEVWCPEGKFIELDPNLKIVGFKPVTVAIYEDDKQTQSYGLEQNYTLRVDAPAKGVRKKVVKVALFDALGKVKTVMQCTMRSNILNPTIAGLGYKAGKEQCGFEIKDREKYKSSCLYLGDMFLGSVKENAGKIDVDERRLPPGTYSCQVVGKNSDDILVPGESSAFTVHSRYEIDCGSNPSNIVIGEHDETMKVTVKHTPGLSIKETRVYIAGNFAGKKAGDSFEMKLPVKKVPSGKCFIEVVGVGDDGVTYPVESLALTVKNDAWWQDISHKPEFEQIEAKKAQIDKLWQEVCTNLERARYEPNIYMSKKTFTLEKITEHYTVGKSAEFQAAAKGAFIHMTQLELQSAKLYRALELRGAAGSLFYRVWKELGSSVPDGEEAKRALDALRNQEAAL